MVVVAQILLLIQQVAGLIILLRGGGGGGYFSETSLSTGTYNIQIGASNGVTNILKDGSILISASNGITPHYTYSDTIDDVADGGNGGSGGGHGYIIQEVGSQRTSVMGYRGTGSNKSSYPFEITSLFAHCAGGAGGTNINTSAKVTYYGTDGGSNGSNGSSTTWDNATKCNSLGGEKGGGNGGRTLSSNNLNATFYGGGGGGNCIQNSSHTGSPGSGYQGVVYLLVPLE